MWFWNDFENVLHTNVCRVKSNCFHQVLSSPSKLLVLYGAINLYLTFQSPAHRKRDWRSFILPIDVAAEFFAEDAK